MKVSWTISSKWVLNIPPYEIEVPDEDLEGLSEEERETVISEYIQDHFQEEVTWARTDK